MNTNERRRYEAYALEFQRLREENGCRFYYPAWREVSPDYMAHTMARDTMATYMRDPLYDEEGRVMRINFQRIRIR